jgi:hypothetical protein
MKVTLTAPAHIAGELVTQMKGLGYTERWEIGTWRDLPESLVRRLYAECSLSPVLPDQKESQHIYIAPIQEEQSDRELLALWRLKYRHEPRIDIYAEKGTPVDGAMRIRFLAAGYKGRNLYERQILSLPISLIKALTASGYPIKTDVPEAMRGEQAKFTETALRVKENWPDEPPEPPTIEAMKEELKLLEEGLKALLKLPQYKEAPGEYEFAEMKYRNLASKIKAAEKRKAEEEIWPQKWLKLAEISEKE